MDSETEFESLLKAAEGGDAEAQHQLGLYFSRGLDGTQKDLREAVRWQTLSAAAGNAGAQLQLGMYYAEGLSDDKGVIVEQDGIKAIEFYVMAAKQKNRDAMIALFKLGKVLLQNPDEQVQRRAMDVVFRELLRAGL